MNPMKHIARTLVVVGLASAAAAATAADVPYPSSARDSYNQTSVFPNISTYESQHRASELSQAPLSYPSAAAQEYPLSSEFPSMQTYQDIHRNDPVFRSATPTFPYSVDAAPSMAEEGLVPGIVGVAPYVVTTPDSAVGGTR
jgi:hypothetical protein